MMAENDQQKPPVTDFDPMKSMTELWKEGGRAFGVTQKRFFEGMTKQMEASAEWARLASSDEQAADSDRLAEASRSFADLWASATKLSSAVANVSDSANSNHIMRQLVNHIFDPQQWLSATGGIDKGFDQMVEGPRLADLFDTEKKFMAVFRAWTALRRCTYEHNALMLQAWARATNEFSAAMNEKAESGESFESWRDVLSVWIEKANTVLLETQQTDAYLASQRHLMNASIELKLAQREIGEFYSAMFDVPTRTEVDDVHKLLTELRREVRALKRPAKRKTSA